MKQNQKHNRNNSALSRGIVPIVYACVILVLVSISFGTSLVRGADPTIVQMVPATQTVSAGDLFVMTVECVPGQSVKAFELKVAFNPSLLQATAVAEGTVFDGYTTFFNPGVIDNTAGTIINVYNLIIGPGTITNPGSFITINFTARSTSGTSSVRLYDVRVTNETDYIPITVSSASVTVIGDPVPPPPSDPPESDNTAPSPPLTPVGPTSIEKDTSYQYSSAAVDPDGDLVRLRFDWGDGTLSNWTELIASNSTVSLHHAWETVDTYTIRVIAQDANGMNSSWSEPLTVHVSEGEEELPPICLFKAPANATANQSIVFDASESYDPDGTIVSYEWGFGDGTTDGGQIVTHTYHHPGQYTVTLTVTDNTGLTSAMNQELYIAASSSPAEPFPLILIFPLFAVVGVVLLALLVFYRYRINGALLKKQRQTSTRNVSQMTIRGPSLQKRIEQRKTSPPRQATANVSVQKPLAKSIPTIAHVQKQTVDIDVVVDGIFAEMRRRNKTLTTSKILDAYNALIIELVEKNPITPIPSVNLKEVEELIDRRMHQLVTERVDKMEPR